MALAKYRVELDGFPTRVYDAPNHESAWDMYKKEFGDKVRRRMHEETPVVTKLDEPDSKPVPVFPGDPL